MLLELLSPGKRGHQYRYAQVLGIYHVNIIYGGEQGRSTNYSPRRMEFLWVRWFDIVASTPAQSGWSAAVLDELRFVEINQEDAFGFVDPNDVLRACHVIPRFALGTLKPSSKTSGFMGNKNNWESYFVNR